MHTIQRSLRSFSLLLALAGAVVLDAGCEKKVDTSLAETDAQNPVAVFQNGVLLLSTPSKEGLIDYATAYTRFQTAAELFDAKGDKKQGSKAHFNAAWVAEATKQIDSAVKHYRAAFEADPTYDRAMFSLARVLSESGKSTEAVALFRAQVERKPDDLQLRNDLLGALATGKQYDAALSEAREILRRDPKNATVYRNLSAMYYAQGNYGMSKLCAEKSLEFNKGDPGTYNNLGVTLLLQEDEPGAIEKFQTSRQLDKSNFEANGNLGWVALNSGDYALALECFQQAAAADPTNTEVKIGLAVAKRGAGDLEGAATLYDQMIKQDPQNELPYFNAAILHEKYTKDYNKALKILQAYADLKSGQIGPDHRVFKRIEEVKASKAAEEARQAEIKRLEQEKKEREERAKAVLKEVDVSVKALEASLAKNSACLDPAVAEELTMFAEQANETIKAEDTGMATDLKAMFTDYYGPMLETAVAAGCGGAAPAPEGGTPPEETPPAPEGGTPPDPEPAPQ